MTVLLGYAPVHTAVHSPPSTLETITACRRDDLGVANGYVKVTDYAVRGLLRPATGGCGEYKSPRNQGALSASS
jgi:hypothetical protein